MSIFSTEQREAWYATTRDSPFNVWLRRQTTGPDGLLDLARLREVATQYGVDADRYAHLNPGQQRMNVGNRLRRLVPAAAYAADSEMSPIAPPKQEVQSDHYGLRAAGIVELLRLQAAAIEEIRRCGVVRTGNAPLGDYAEYLFARALGWSLTPNSASGHDAIDGRGTRYQIKARRLRTNTPGERQLSVLRALPDQRFDMLAAVLFDSDFAVRRAALIPHAVVLQRAARIDHVNGWRFILDDAVWRVAGVEDVTDSLRAAVDSA